MTNNNKVYGGFFAPMEKKPKPKPTPKSSWLAMQYSHAGVYIIVPLFLGLIVGVIFDNIFHTKPLWTLVGLSFGLLASFYNMFALMKSLKK